MKNTSIRTLSRLMEGLCTGLLVLGGAVILLLPWLLKGYLRYHSEGMGGRIYACMLALLYLSGVCAFIILLYGRRILHDIAHSDPFTLQTARRMRAIAAWCAPIGVGYLIAIPLLPSVLILLVGLAFCFLPVVMLICAELFWQAAQYKQENDLTI